eukprot:1152599-Pelagomonas_calceolata.AAC.4
MACVLLAGPCQACNWRLAQLRCMRRRRVQRHFRCMTGTRMPQQGPACHSEHVHAHQAPAWHNTSNCMHSKQLHATASTCVAQNKQLHGTTSTCLAQQAPAWHKTSNRMHSKHLLAQNKQPHARQAPAWHKTSNCMAQQAPAWHSKHVHAQPVPAWHNKSTCMAQQAFHLLKATVEQTVT